LLEHGSLPGWQTKRFQRLSGRLSAGTFPSALLLIGSEGVGKRRLGDALVRAVYCEQRGDSDPACGQCGGCRQLAAGSHPDLVICEPEEGKQSITVDVIREFSRRLYLTPQTAAGRVGYMPRADLMNVNAANALLKTLEEPPSTAHLILIADRPAHLPATIRSRCEQVRAVVESPEEAEAWLEEQFPDLSPALRQRLVMQPLLAESAQRHAQQESEIRRQLDIVWSQQRDPVLAAGELDDELLPRVGRVIHSCIADQFRLQMKQGASTRGRLAMQRLVDANAAALHLSQTSQANLRLLAETQLIEWARTGRLLTQN